MTFIQKRKPRSIFENRGFDLQSVVKALNNKGTAISAPVYFEQFIFVLCQFRALRMTSAGKGSPWAG